MSQTFSSNDWQPVVKAIALTTLALIAFAANSVLCRRALGEDTIDAASFTGIRLLAGAVMLILLVRLGNSQASVRRHGNWLAGAMLFLYAVCFSYAYISLDTGTGALILFGSVQISMIVMSLFAGNRLHGSEWLGVAIAFAGFVYLVLPGVSSPSLLGFVLMTTSGIAWGVYTLKGRGSVNPLLDTAANFVYTLPLVIVLVLLSFRSLEISMEGVVLAILSGALASGIGYAVWYRALRRLTSTQAAVVQLAVPVIAALGGVVFMNEIISLRLALAALVILGGILLVVLGRYYFVRPVA